MELSSVSVMRVFRSWGPRASQRCAAESKWGEFFPAALAISTKSCADALSMAIRVLRESSAEDGCSLRRWDAPKNTVADIIMSESALTTYLCWYKPATLAARRAEWAPRADAAGVRSPRRSCTIRLLKPVAPALFWSWSALAPTQSSRV